MEYKRSGFSCSSTGTALEIHQIELGVISVIYIFYLFLKRSWEFYYIHMKRLYKEFVYAQQWLIH